MPNEFCRFLPQNYLNLWWYLYRNIHKQKSRPNGLKSVWSFATATRIFVVVMTNKKNKMSAVLCLTNTVMQYIASATGAITKDRITDMIQWRYAQDSLKSQWNWATWELASNFSSEWKALVQYNNRKPLTVAVWIQFICSIGLDSDVYAPISYLAGPIGTIRVKLCSIATGTLYNMQYPFGISI